MVEKFIALRDKTAEIRKRHQEELAKYNLVMGQLEAWLLGSLHDAKVKSMRSDHGTFFITVRTSARVASWTDALTFIRDNEAWELLEARVSSTAAQAIVLETGQAVPGVEITREETLSVRRA
jgi:hypothetical protein